jgi:hypothetical protein
MICEVKNSMKYLIVVILVCSFLAGAVGSGQEVPRSMTVSLIEILAAPQKYEGKLVTVRGFLLVLGGHHDIAAYSLCLNKDDAENELGNSVLVVPNEQMQRDREKFDRMYVSLTGFVNSVRGADGTYSAVIKDVKECRVWSDPSRPILLNGHGSAKIK